MEFQENLTNEKIKQRFTSQFELVGYAIKLADNMMKTGRGPRIAVESQNLAINVLAEINAGLDRFEDIPKETTHDYETNHRTYDRKEFQNQEPRAKNHEKKRTRKIFTD